MSWYMVKPNGHGMVYGMALRAWHGAWYGIWYSLVDMARYMVSVVGVAFGLAVRVWHGIWYGLQCLA